MRLAVASWVLEGLWGSALLAHRVGCLPAAEGQHLFGIITLHRSFVLVLFLHLGHWSQLFSLLVLMLFGATGSKMTFSGCVDSTSWGAFTRAL